MHMIKLCTTAVIWTRQIVISMITLMIIKSNILQALAQQEQMDVKRKIDARQLTKMVIYIILMALKAWIPFTF